MDSILNWYREEGIIFKGGSGAGHQPVADPLQRRAARGRRHGVRPGQLHARRRRLGGHDQVGRQDAPGGEDGHPRRRPPRRRGVHLVQGQGGAQGTRAARRRLRHGPRRRRLVLDPVPERQQLGAGHRRVHAGRRSTTPTGSSRPSPPARCCRRSGPATCGARSPQAAWECADPGLQFDTTINRWHTAHTTRAGSTAATRAASTCTSTTSACNLASINLLKYLDEDDTFDVDAFCTRSRSCSPPRRSSSAGPTTRPSRSPRRAATSASSASATPTSARC